MKKFLSLLTLVAAFGLSACAATYKAPETKVAANVSSQIIGSPQDTLNRVKQVLLLDGYQIQSYDNDALIVSTSFKNKRITPTDANCGTTLGLDYLKDKRTDTSVAINVLIVGTTITVTANIHGAYKPGSADQNITLSCVSKGAIERSILAKIIG